ncbi:MAG TPA: hypothetical protein VK171_02975 [Fimbriimonas sp.]|nr:hypothetical protein [Fimbriimonas sp.]
MKHRWRTLAIVVCAGCICFFVIFNRLQSNSIAPYKAMTGLSQSEVASRIKTPIDAFYNSNPAFRVTGYTAPKRTNFYECWRVFESWYVVYIFFDKNGNVESVEVCGG